MFGGACATYGEDVRSIEEIPLRSCEQAEEREDERDERCRHGEQTLQIGPSHFS